MLLAATAVNDKNGVTTKAAVKASDRFTCIWESSLSLAVGKRYVFRYLGVTFPHGGAAKDNSVSLRMAAQKKLREPLSPPKGGSIFWLIFAQFLSADEYVKQKINGESSTSGGRAWLYSAARKLYRPQVTV